MNNSLIYMFTNTASSVLEGGILPITSYGRRRGCSIESGSNSIELKSAGYYKVSVNVTFTGQSAGDASFEVRKSGVAIPSMIASETITTPSTEYRSISITGVVRVGLGEVASLSIVNTGIAVTTSSITIDVEYLD